jgi:hypothetical protein
LNKEKAPKANTSLSMSETKKIKNRVRDSYIVS